MARLRVLLVAGIVTALLLSFAPTSLATHNNQGTVKVHDNPSENPAQRNVPHVNCDFWIEGSKMGDDSGWIVFFGWPPTGDMSEIESGEDQNWTADSGNASGEYHFLAGPFTLESGHYRVEVYTDDGHPGSDSGHFAKTKTFWVECEELPPVNPPCPPNVQAIASGDGETLSITLTWDAVADADAYAIYRATGGADFELLHMTDETGHVDLEVEGGLTYEYYVTAVIDGFESEQCELVEATTIPFFPTIVVGALAVLGGVGAFVALRRRS